MKNQNGFIKFDGNKVTYRGSVFGQLSTSQPIPTNLRSFIFKTRIVECSKDVRIGLGFKFDGGCIRWINDTGYLDTAGKGIITALESYGENDDIFCYLRRIPIKQKDYQYFKWIKNGKAIGSCMIDGKNVLPYICFDALHGSVQTAEVETSFDIKPPSNTSGKFFTSQE